MSGNPVSGTAGVTGGGAEASDIHGLKTGAQYPSSTPAPATTGAQAPSAVPATAGYSGGGATVSDEHGVPTGKQYQGSTAQGSAPTGASAGTGATAGAQGGQGSVIGAGTETPMTAVPTEGTNTGNTEKMSAQDKACAKTATLAAGVQEDLNKFREKLTVKDGVQAPPPGAIGAPAGEYQPGTQGSEKTSFTDKVKGFAVRAIDHTQAALEGAKQNVTKHTTAPASGADTTSAAAPGTSGAGASTGTTGAPTSH